jgi:hypothetical protein
MVGQSFPVKFTLEQLDVEFFSGSSTEDRLAEEGSRQPVFSNLTSEIYGIVSEPGTGVSLPLKDLWPFQDPTE